MKFEEVLPALRGGKEVRRDGVPWKIDAGSDINLEHILADDWEVVEEYELYDKKDVEQAAVNDIGPTHRQRLACEWLRLMAVADAAVLVRFNFGSSAEED